MNILPSCYNSRYHSDFKSLCERQNESLADFENAIRDFVSEVKNHDMPTKFMLDWQNKFFDAMNYESISGDEYIRNKRRLQKVDDVIREFIDEVRKCEDNYKMPKDMYAFVESMKHLKFMRHWQDKFYDSMNLPF